MSELETILNTLKVRNKCKVGLWLDKQPDNFEATLNAAVEGNNKFIVYRACSKMGMTVANSTFYRHLNKECTCF